MNIQRYRRPRAFAWVALCALAMLQFATAAHDSQHSLADVADACAICVQLDSGGNVLQASVAQSIHTPPTDEFEPLISRTSDRRPASSLRARAPPRS